MRSNSARPPIILPLLLVVIGVFLLLKNFMLLDSIEALKNLDLTRFWPVLLVLAGFQLLIRGDLGLTWQASPFGITRGNVQSAELESSSGELDVKVRALRREGRLIAGQYTGRSRPNLVVRGDHARLSMQRGSVWPFSQADWEIGLAKDLPWDLLISSHLGELDIDLRGLLIRRANFGSGIGDIKVTAPELPLAGDDQVGGGIRACSTFGNVTLVIPPGVEAAVRILAKPTARIQIDESRFLMLEQGVFATLGYEQSAAPLLAEVSSTFGTIRLA
ncbi:MAG TPA: DUF5668 domain-containing protein [Aggregatilineales bacterium]|nr:DUF5668 domain-containing protein [Aggregatilineales bacterium]